MNKDSRLKEKRELVRKIEEMNMLADLDDNFPFERTGGGGAPLRDEQGKVITALKPHDSRGFSRVRRQTSMDSRAHLEDDELDQIPTDALQQSLVQKNVDNKDSKKLEKFSKYRPDYVLSDT
jgi:hypothetical protein